MVPEAGLEPARRKTARDFKSLVSTNSTTPALNENGGDTRIRTGDKDFADPCLTTWRCRRYYAHNKMERETRFELATTTLATWSSTTELLPLGSNAKFRRQFSLSNIFIKFNLCRLHSLMNRCRKIAYNLAVVTCDLTRMGVV